MSGAGRRSTRRSTRCNTIRSGRCSTPPRRGSSEEGSPDEHDEFFGTQHLALFIVSGLLLAITPGQDTLYIIGRSVSQGRRAGLLSVMGIVTGIAALLFLGAVFIVTGTLWCLILVWSASAMSRPLRERNASGLWLKRATGALFVGLGVRLAVSK